MTRLLSILRFSAGFGVARALLFASPIVLANLLSLEGYGQFELAHSYATIGALLLGFGLPATVPLIRLRDEVAGRWDTLLGLIASLAGISLLAAGLAAAGMRSLYETPVLVLLAIAVLILQGFWATLLKTDGRSTSAVFVEAGFWGVAVLGAGLIALTGKWLPDSTITVALLIYAVGLMTVTLAKLVRARTGSFDAKDLRRNFELGMPLMLSSLLTAILSSSGRLILGQSSGVEAVGLYAVLFRSTTIPLVGHQILIVGFFRHIFSWSEESLRQRLTIIVLGVSAMAAAFWLLEPWLGWLLGPRFVEVFAAYRAEGLVLLVQTILWSAIALNDLINSRLQIAGRVTLVTAPYLLIGLGALYLWVWNHAQSVEISDLLHGFILGHFCLMAGFYALQCAVSWWLGHLFIRLWLSVAACTAGAGLLIALTELFL
ncbi:oligosaccharide flippase family protein [Qipengyuania gaetbuli]|uniref:oligosaccharide flippase family protein n=1 Tax=Qipengyuania gaetbuli TaxID=266952 RepID=UPI001CFD3B10|nr:oligosaccharide flippase family protein [Qipengyuania gaetbuli]